jgi:AcrR family transcriptional regulator
MEKEETGKNREQIILDAAENVFLEHGFEAARTTMIAAQAGVTHAMLHYYFRTKENIFNMVFDKKIQLLKDSLFVLMQNPELPFLERIRIGIEAHFNFIAENPSLPRFAINELINKPERWRLFETKVRNSAQQLIDGMRREIDREVALGTICPIDPVVLLLDIASLNIFVFAVMPVVRTFAMSSCKDENEFFEVRRKENVEIIMRRLKPVYENNGSVNNL